MPDELATIRDDLRRAAEIMAASAEQLSQTTDPTIETGRLADRLDTAGAVLLEVLGEMREQ